MFMYGEFDLMWVDEEPHMPMCYPLTPLDVALGVVQSNEPHTYNNAGRCLVCGVMETPENTP